MPTARRARARRSGSRWPDASGPRPASGRSRTTRPAAPGRGRGLAGRAVGDLVDVALPPLVSQHDDDRAHDAAVRVADHAEVPRLEAGAPDDVVQPRAEGLPLADRPLEEGRLDDVPGLLVSPPVPRGSRSPRAASARGSCGPPAARDPRVQRTSQPLAEQLVAGRPDGLRHADRCRAPLAGPGDDPPRQRGADAEPVVVGMDGGVPAVGAVRLGVARRSPDGARTPTLCAPRSYDGSDQSATRSAGSMATSPVSASSSAPMTAAIRSASASVSGRWV